MLYNKTKEGKRVLGILIYKTDHMPTAIFNSLCFGLKDFSPTDGHVKFGVFKLSSGISLGWDAGSETFDHTGAQEPHSQSHKWPFEANLSGCRCPCGGIGHPGWH